MKILVTLSICGGWFTSPLCSTTLNPQPKTVSLILKGPERVQELRDSNNYSPEIAKWLSSIKLNGSSIPQDRFDELLCDFALRVSDANTFGIIEESGSECLEMTAVFSNLSTHGGGLVHSFSTLQGLVKDVTLPDTWSD